MNDIINYKNNPLHGVSLKTMLNELVDHYGFEILYAYLNINCFQTHPSIDSSVKFLKRTDWAREKVEAFYLYEFKHLPRASAEQFGLPPRDRIVPEGQTPGKPKQLSLEDAQRLREKRAKKSAGRGRSPGNRAGSTRRSDTQRNGGYTHKRDPDRTRQNDRKSSDFSKPSDASEIDPWARSRE